ncbi:hypothetical protein SAMN02745898_10948 [Streptomyces sp. 136MFCol5.1]|nr:hypothetical protein SAMN02745898_10948 [Streptomyces sp. 136MFCol5.1]
MLPRLSGRAVLIRAALWARARRRGVYGLLWASGQPANPSSV